MSDITELRLPPNMEALVSSFLRDQDEVADWVADRVYTVLPKPQKDVEIYPCVRVTQLLDQPAGAPLWAVAFMVQVEAFGGTKATAWTIASTCRAAIDLRLKGEYPAFGVVNGSTPGALLDLPDQAFEPAKPRWLFTSTIYGHPLATMPDS